MRRHIVTDLCIILNVHFFMRLTVTVPECELALYKVVIT